MSTTSDPNDPRLTRGVDTSPRAQAPAYPRRRARPLGRNTPMTHTAVATPPDDPRAALRARLRAAVAARLDDLWQHEAAAEWLAANPWVLDAAKQAFRDGRRQP